MTRHRASDRFVLLDEHGRKSGSFDGHAVSADLSVRETRRGGPERFCEVKIATDHRGLCVAARCCAAALERSRGSVALYLRRKGDPFAAPVKVGDIKRFVCDGSFEFAPPSSPYATTSFLLSADAPHGLELLRREG